MTPVAARAAGPPSATFHELVLTAQSSIDQHQIASITVVSGVVLFAVVSAIMLVHAWARAARIERRLRKDNARLREEVDRANALMRSEPQVVVIWPAGSNEPKIDGDPTAVGVAMPHQVLAFGSWLDAAKATAMERAVEALRGRGEAFTMALTTRAGDPIEALGRAIGGRAVLRLKNASGTNRELVELATRHDKLAAEVAPLRALIDAISSPVWARDVEGRLIFVNAAYARAVDANTAADAVRQRTEFLDSAARAGVAQAHMSGSAYAGRLRAVAAGTRRIFDVLDIITDSGSTGIAIDASEAEAMRAARDHLVDAHRRTLDQLPIGVAMFGPDQRLTFYNAAYRALWDLDAAFLDQNPTDSAVIETLRAARKLPEQQDFRQWKAQLHETYRAVEPTEHTWHLPGGRTLRVVTTPNPDGGLTYLFHDVTEGLDLQRRFQELIRVQGETLDNLAEGVAVFGSDGRLRLHNAAFVSMWKLNPGDLADRPHIERITALCRPLHGGAPTWQTLRRVITAIDNREATRGRIELRDGSAVDSITVPLPDGATLVTFHDVTASVNVERALRERNEALEDADKIKIDFVHHVSYELRSPLTNIIGFVHLLGDPATGPLGRKQREYLDYITVSTNSLLALINNILDLATIDAGRMQLNLGAVDIRETMMAAAEGVQDRLVSSGLTLDIAATENIGSFIADKLRVRQILFNLLANAASFSPGGGKIVLRAERRAEAIAFSVTDQGPGIPPDVLGKVFDWFETYPLGSAHRGPGIGLSLVRSFVELHGGTVAIASEVGHGTTVTCTFPLATGAALTAAE
ncbi:MAG TPA: PAS-domain containing protein [Xanthobacteraceae bacterium]|nr:PAS-domain containing protein [Xanthobacteraceae bacterium]